MDSEKVPPLFEFRTGAGPLVAAAIHDGHAVRPELLPLLNLAEGDRLREEDPFTRHWTTVAPTRVIGCRSRFEVDLNRPREKAVYLTPEDAWGLQVWKSPLPEDVIAETLALYDDFYAEVKTILRELIADCGCVVVYDIHTYNHRRGGPEGPLADPEANPAVNLGTGTMNRERWAPVVDRFLHDLRSYDYPGSKLDVRENVRFRGGNFGRWAHETFPDTVCVLSIEFKKFFMNEWTGEADHAQVEAIRDALASTTPGVLAALESLK